MSSLFSSRHTTISFIEMPNTLEMAYILSNVGSASPRNHRYTLLVFSIPRYLLNSFTVMPFSFLNLEIFFPVASMSITGYFIFFTLPFQVNYDFKLWRRDLNPRHMAYKATALTTKLLHIDHLCNNSSQIQKHHTSATDMWCYISNIFLYSDYLCLYSTFYSTQISPVFFFWIWDICMLCNCVVKLKYNIAFAPLLSWFYYNTS